MTSEPRRDAVTDPLLTPENSALIVIDFQPNQLQAVTSIDHDVLSRRIVAVARLAKIFGLPIVLSTVMCATHGARQPSPSSRRSSPTRPSSTGPRSTPGRTSSSGGRSRRPAGRS